MTIPGTVDAPGEPSSDEPERMPEADRAREEHDHHNPHHPHTDDDRCEQMRAAYARSAAAGGRTEHEQGVAAHVRAKAEREARMRNSNLAQKKNRRVPPPRGGERKAPSGDNDVVVREKPNRRLLSLGGGGGGGGGRGADGGRDGGGGQGARDRMQDMRSQHLERLKAAIDKRCPATTSLSGIMATIQSSLTG